jgi:NhaP-type Na+/H+ or K+/H+ antiporter
LGGIAMGIAFGFACLLFLKFFKKNMLMFINMIFISSYSVFYVCEKENLNFSGLLSLVSLGLTLNMLMKE